MPTCKVDLKMKEGGKRESLNICIENVFLGLGTRAVQYQLQLQNRPPVGPASMSGTCARKGGGGTAARLWAPTSPTAMTRTEGARGSAGTKYYSKRLETPKHAV